MKFTAKILGRPVVKKNTQRVIRSGGRTFVIYSKKYAAWKNSAILQLRAQGSSGVSFDKPVNAEFRFYFENHSAEPDLGNVGEGCADILQELGVLANDRLIHILRLEKHFGETPRMEIEITEIVA